MNRLALTLLLACFVALAAASSASACPACKEAVGDTQARAYGYSIFFMLGTMLSVLGGFGGAFYVMCRREARRRDEAAKADDRETPPPPASLP
jgi:hypothetical protein